MATRFLITILDETNPNDPIVIGGYNPNLGSGSGNPTDIPANETNAYGDFSVQVSATGFVTTGIKTIGIEATDASGTVGNVATIKIDLQATLTSITAPTAPVITLDPSSDSSNGQGVTNDTTPQIDGTTSPNTQVALTVVSGPGYPSPVVLGTTTSNEEGDFTFQMPTLGQGTYVLQATATNTANGLTTTGPEYSFEILTAGPTQAPTLTLSSSSVTGSVIPNTTADRFPYFVGVTDPNDVISLYLANSAGTPTGKRSSPRRPRTRAAITRSSFPYALSDGSITLVATVHDLAGNPEAPATPPTSTPLTINIVSVVSDYTGTGATTPAVFDRESNGTGVWYVYGVAPAMGTPFGGATVDIPFTGDFDATASPTWHSTAPVPTPGTSSSRASASKRSPSANQAPSPPSATSAGAAKPKRPTTSDHRQVVHRRLHQRLCRPHDERRQLRSAGRRHSRAGRLHQRHQWCRPARSSIAPAPASSSSRPAARLPPRPFPAGPPATFRSRPNTTTPRATRRPKRPSTTRPPARSTSTGRRARARTPRSSAPATSPRRRLSRDRLDPTGRVPLQHNDGCEYLCGCRRDEPVRHLRRTGDIPLTAPLAYRTVPAAATEPRSRHRL